MKKKFGIIGDPIKHSLSPVLHNYWFKKYNINAKYSLINIKENEFPNIIKKIKHRELDGINVTLPYKQKIVPYLDRLVNDAEVASSVNTIFLDENNMLIGENTDVFGVQAAYLKEVDNIKSKKALVLGAGGVSPSILLSLIKSGIKQIAISNRTSEKCFFLKNKFKQLKIIEWKSFRENLKEYDIIINATSLGLKNGEDYNFNFETTREDSIFIDTIYNPLETKTFKYLKEKGLKVFNGLDMFIYQGQKSFYLWTKINPEIDQKLVETLLSELK